MRIKQGSVLYGFFRKSFLGKYGLVRYHNPNEPVIVRGCKRKNYTLLQKHKDIAVIIWAGTDAMYLKNNTEMVQFLKNNQHRYFHVAISNFICRDLEGVGLKYKKLPVSSFTYEGFSPCPHGNSIYVYLPNGKPEFYGKPQIQELQKKLKEYNFIFCAATDYSRKELINIYKQCFIGLRLTPHDGLSNTVVELGMMGRRAVWNGDTPNAIPFKNINDVVNIIKKEKNTPPKTPSRIYNEMTDYMNIGDEWLYTEYYANFNYIPKKKHTASVVINTYKEIRGNLVKTIKGFKNQKDVDMQIIISTVKEDSAIEIAKEFDCDVCISDEPGIYTQLNNAIKLVKNDWYCYMSGNDEVYSTKIIDEINCCLQQGKLVCYSNFVRFKNGKKISTRRFKDYDYAKHLKGNFVNDAALVHKSILDKYTPFNVKWGNSAYYDFWLRIYEGEGNVFCHNNKNGFKYIIRTSSKHEKRKKDITERLKTKKLRELMLQQHISLGLVDYDTGINDDTKEGNGITKRVIKHTTWENKKNMKRIRQKEMLEKEKEVQKRVEAMRAGVSSVKKKKNEYDFVYVWVNTDNNAKHDLLNSIKSVRKFFDSKARIFVVGDDIEINGVINIKTHRIKGYKHSKAIDAATKLKLITEITQIQKEFIYIYDDVIFLRPFTYKQLKDIIAIDYVENYHSYFNGSANKPHPRYLELFERTHALIKEHNLSKWNYETHLPRVLNKEMVSIIIDKYNLQKQPYLFNTLYFNHFFKAPQYSLRKDIPNFMAGIYRPHEETSIKGIMSGATILSYNDSGLNDILKKQIREVLR